MSGSTTAYPTIIHSSPQTSSEQFGQLSQIRLTSTTNLDTPSSYEQSRRQVSSIVVAEELLGPPPEQNKVTYVEVPVVKELIKYVPKKSVVEVEKLVPKYETEYVEKIVEVPQIEWVEYPIEKVIQHEPGTKLIQEIQKEVTITKPVIEKRQTERIVEVPGEVIEIPIIKKDPADMERADYKPDKEVPVVVAQTVRPVLTEVYDTKETANVYAFNPNVMPVDLLVAKPVPSQLIVVGPVAQEHKRIDVPPPQFNTMLKALNKHLSEEELANLPYQIDPTCGRVSFLHPSHTPGIVEVQNEDLTQEMRTQQLQECQEQRETDNTCYEMQQRRYSTTASKQVDSFEDNNEGGKHYMAGLPSQQQQQHFGKHYVSSTTMKDEGLDTERYATDKLQRYVTEERPTRYVTTASTQQRYVTTEVKPTAKYTVATVNPTESKIYKTTTTDKPPYEFHESQQQYGQTIYMTTTEGNTGRERYTTTGEQRHSARYTIPEEQDYLPRNVQERRITGNIRERRVYGDQTSDVEKRKISYHQGSSAEGRQVTGSPYDRIVTTASKISHKDSCITSNDRLQTTTDQYLQAATSQLQDTYQTDAGDALDTTVSYTRQPTKQGTTLKKRLGCAC